MTKFNAKISLALILFLLFGANFAIATVTIPTVTGGTNISNDLSRTHPSGGGYTTLSDIVIADAAPGDFATGANKTLTLKAPTAWAFLAETGTIASTGPNLTINSMVVSEGTILINYTVSGTPGIGNSIIISGIKVQATTSVISPTSLYITKSAGQAIVGLANGDRVVELSKVAGAATSLQVLLPGQVNNPAVAPGRSGTILGQNVGVNFSVVVNAVDFANNICKTNTDLVSLTTNNYFLTAPIDLNLVEGSATFNVALTTATATGIVNNLTAHNISAPSVNQNTSANVLVTRGEYAKLIALLPGQTLDPGSITGIGGTAIDRVSGVATTITVFATDIYFNRIASLMPNNTIKAFTNDPLSVSPPDKNISASGSTTFSVIFKTVGELYTVEVSDETLGAISYTTAPVKVVAGAFAKFQVLLPGEENDPGTSTGKKNSPFPLGNPKAGESFKVVVNAVDAFWNIVHSVDEEISITTTDLLAILPASQSLNAGSLELDVTLITAVASGRVITANHATDGSKTGASAQFGVSPNAYVRLAALLPGQSLTPSLTNGIIGNTGIPSRGTQFLVRLRAVDQYFNPINGITHTVSLIKSAAADVVPPNANLVSTNFANVYMTINETGPQEIIITDGTTLITTTLIIPDSDGFVTTISDHFRSASSGIWGNSTTWESSIDGVTGWHPATLTPTSASKSITIRNLHNVEVQASVSVDEVLVEAGAELLVSVGTLTVANGASETDMQINGVIATANSGVITSTVGKTLISSVGKYQHRYATSGGTIPQATWETGSTLEIVGYTSYAGAITNSSQTFSNIVWNCPLQNNVNSGPGLGANFTADNVQIISTGNGMMFLSSSVGVSNILGNLQIVDGKVGMTRSGTRVINLEGDLILENGQLDRGIAAATVNFVGSSKQNFRNTAVSIAGAIDFNIAAGAIVDFGTSVLGGTSGTFSLADGATIITAHPQGIASTGINEGSIQNTGARNYGLANYTYNGTVAQIVGSGLPSTVNNFTVDNSNGVSLPVGANTFTVNGVLAVSPLNGFLDLATHPLAGTFTEAGTGSLKTAVLSNAFVADRTWLLGVEFSANSTQQIVSGNYHNLSFSGAGVKVGPVSGLNVAGNWSSSGGQIDFESNSTPLNFNGSAAQLLTDLGSNSGNGLKFQSVTFSGAGLKTLNSGMFSLSPTGILTMDDNASLNANNNLTILSTEASTGTIAAIPSSAVISGNVIAQRFVKGGSKHPFRTYRILSSPIYDNAAGKTYSFSQFIDDMVVTGDGGTASGFDNAPGSGASAWTYNPSVATTSKYVAIPNINTSLKAGQGAYLFFRGDRGLFPASITGPDFTDATSTIVDFEGVLNQQDIVVPLEYNPEVSGFNLVGNPYASSIDWMSPNIDKSGLANNVIMTWDASTRQYSVFDGIESVNGGGPIIPSGQGFFVQANGISPNLIFRESAKTGSQPTFLLMSRPLGADKISISKSFAGKIAEAHQPNATMGAVYTKVNITLSKKDTPYQIETAVVLQEGKSENYVANEDVKYLKGSEVFLSTSSSDGVALAINYMPALRTGREIKLSIDDSRVTSGNYTFSLDYLNLPAEYLVNLRDNYLSTSVPVSNGGVYDFSIDELDAQSFGNNRFSLYIENPNVLPIEVTSLKAAKVAAGVSVSWNTVSAVNASNFELERAGDDKVYKKIYSVPSKGVKVSYSYLDSSPLIGNNYYRVKQVDYNQAISITSPVAVNFDGKLSAVGTLDIYPNPVQGQFTVKYNGVLNNGTSALKLTSSTGQVILEKLVSRENLVEGKLLDMPNIPAGVYILELFDGGAKSIQQRKLIKQ